jgi:HEPN domain-containing protein
MLFLQWNVTKILDKIKQIEYWIKSATDDLISAELLISNNRNIHGLFLCHLCIEKSIKAHIVRVTGQIPPKLHKLGYLLELTDLVLTEEDKDLCAILMIYQLEGRYPEYYPNVPAPKVAMEYLNKTKLLHQWLRERL